MLVSTQPIEVRVVGDPKVLASALDLITHSPYFGLVLDVEKKRLLHWWPILLIRGESRAGQ